MSKLLAVDKSETSTIYTLSKDNQFYKQMSKVFKNIGFENHNLPVDFPDNLSDGEKPLDLKKEFDYFENIREKEESIILVYGKNKIFLIIHSKQKFMKTFNKEFNKIFPLS